MISLMQHLCFLSIIFVVATPAANERNTYNTYYLIFQTVYSERELIKSVREQKLSKMFKQ